MPAPVIIAPYDPAWPSTFLELHATLADALGDIAVDIVHVGSTAVPGLAAKPIIDLVAVIESDDRLPTAIERLARIGYTFESDLGVAGRYAFRPPPPHDIHHHHLYVCAKSNRALKEQIAFRDYLRSNPEAAGAYASLKRAAAEAHRNDRTAYTNAKTEFVTGVLATLGVRC
jgi:GrpB-like predicted nucleotidyltransferase (UPF0157 family)